MNIKKKWIKIILRSIDSNLKDMFKREIMMYNTVIVILFALFVSSCKQDYIEMNVLNKQPIVISKNDTVINVTVELINHSDKNYILYAFYNLINDHFGIDSILCSGDCFVGVTAIFAGKNHESIIMSIWHHEDELYRIISEQKRKLDEQILYLTPHHEYPESIVLKHHDKIILNEQISITKNESLNFKFKTNPSYFKIIYYSGDRIYRYINKDEAKKQTELYNAQVFKGCIISDYVKIEFE